MGKKEENTPSTRKLKRRLLTGLGTAGLVGGGYWTMRTSDSPEAAPTPPPVTLAPEEPDERPHIPPAVVVDKKTGRTALTDTPPPEAQADTPDAAESAPALELKPEDFFKYRLELVKKDNQIQIMGVPQTIEPEGTSSHYLAGVDDPLYAVPEGISAGTIDYLLEDYRTQLRAGYVNELPYNLHREQWTRSPPKTHDTTANPDEYVPLATMPAGKKVVLPIHLGNENSPEHQWFKALAQRAEELAQELNRKINPQDPLVQCLHDFMATSGNVGDAKRVLRRIYALEDQDREAFAVATRAGNFGKAKTILKRMSATQHVDESLFGNVQRFVIAAKADGLNKNDIAYELGLLSEYGINPDTPSRSARNPEGEPIEYNPETIGVIQQLQGTMSPAQLKALLSLPPYMVKTLVETAFKPDKDYWDFRKKLDEREQSPAYQIASDAELQKLAEYANTLFGRDNKSGAMAKGGRANIISLTELLSFSDRMEDLGRLAKTVSGLIQVRNGTAQMLVPLPEDIKQANMFLYGLGVAMQAAHNDQRLLGGPFHEDGSPASLSKRLGDSFAIELGEGGESSNLPSPIHYLRTFGQLPADKFLAQEGQSKPAEHRGGHTKALQGSHSNDAPSSQLR